ncbi:uncharacterized protein PRD47_018394 isoform 2-T2 [Ara ararauna]
MGFVPSSKELVGSKGLSGEAPRCKQGSAGAAAAAFTRTPSVLQRVLLYRRTDAPAPRYRRDRGITGAHRGLGAKRSPPGVGDTRSGAGNGALNRSQRRARRGSRNSPLGLGLRLSKSRSPAAPTPHHRPPHRCPTHTARPPRGGDPPARRLRRKPGA